jgi:microcystin-dependent protein
MSDPYLGQIIAVGFDFAPIGWELCHGQTLPIAQNQSLYQLIGTTYGGDGDNTFGLPDLRGRVAISKGQGPTLSNYTVGQSGGAENVVLTAAQNAAHSHPLLASSQTGTSNTPDGNSALAGGSATQVSIYDKVAPTTSLAPGSITTSGIGGPHENRQPFLTINYIIATNGQFPPRG